MGQAGDVDLGISVAPFFNLALQQNGVSVLRELTLRNQGPHAWENLQLSMRCQPAWSVERVWACGSLAAGGRLSLEDLAVDIPEARLAEPLSVTLQFELRSGRELIAEQTVDCRCMPPGHWCGPAEPPLGLVQHVLPSDRAIAGLLGKVRSILLTETKDGKVQGYAATNPKRIAQITGGVYFALSGLGLKRDQGPPFAQLGQRLRSPTEISVTKQAGELELALLMAACLEAGGLRPLLILSGGQIVLGCWLKPARLTDPCKNDLREVRKRLRQGDLLVLMPGLLTSTPLQGLRQARELALKALVSKSADQWVLDVAELRRVGYRPYRLPSESEGSVSPVALTQVVDEAAGPGSFLDGLLNKWRERLSESAADGVLMRFDMDGDAQTLLCHRAEIALSALLEGRSFLLRSRQELPGAKAAEQGNGAELAEMLSQALNRREWVIDGNTDVVTQGLVNLHRRANDLHNRQGRQGLYLAYGTLAKASGKAGEPVWRAPLLLLPVTLIRVQGTSGFRLSALDLPLRFNPLLADIPALAEALGMTSARAEQLLEGIGKQFDVAWNEIHAAVRDLPEWHLDQRLVLGMFDAASDRWLKLHLDRRRADLRTDPVVRRLVAPAGDESEQTGQLTDTARLDNQLTAERLFGPLPASAAQLMAIMNTVKGLDWLLTGPNGSGKRQTIANLIAQTLADGKSVLVVAPGNAFLADIWGRLAAVGLGTHCLLLQNELLAKPTLRERVSQAWQAGAAVDDDAWRQNARQLDGARHHLSDLFGCLHRVYPNGWSAFRALGECLRLADLPTIDLGLHFQAPGAAPSVDEELALANTLDELRGDLGSLLSHPLRDIRHTEWSSSWQTELTSASRAGRKASQRLTTIAAEYLRLLNLGLADLSLDQLGALRDLHQLLRSAPGLPLSFLFDPKADEIATRLSMLFSLLRRVDEDWRELSAPYRHDVIYEDLDDMLATLTSAESAWGPLRRRRRAEVIAQLLPHIANGQEPMQPMADLRRLRDMGGLIKDIRGMANLSGVVGAGWKGAETDPATIAEMLRLHGLWSRLLPCLVEDPEQRQNVAGRVADLLVDPLALSPEGALIGHGTAFEREFDQLRNLLDRLGELAGLDAVVESSAPGALEAVEELLADWEANEGELRDWCNWLAANQRATETALATVLAASKDMPDGLALADLFSVNYARTWLAVVMESDPLLAGFNPSEYANEVERYREREEQQRALAAEQVVGRVRARMPQPDQEGAEAVWAYLRQITQDDTRLSAKSLFASAAKVVTRLVPCVMTSPSGVVEHLPDHGKLFDLVILAGAEQMRLADALPALLTARQTVVVGNDHGASEAGGLLDQARSAGLTGSRLDRNYAALSDQLLAFSRQRFGVGRGGYFPKADGRGAGLQVSYVRDGVFARAQTRTNRVEADRLVDAVIGQLRGESDAQSVAIIAFTEEQRRLIEALLDLARRRYPKLEERFDAKPDEPLIVRCPKGLAGEVRDRVYWSLTFAPDTQGRLCMEFGDLSLIGGEHLLNAALSCARRELSVFASLRSDQIDLGRSHAAGVRDLKNFLAFAEQDAKGRALAGSAESRAGAFEMVVMAAMRRHGWRMVAGAESGNPVIDLMVEHPDRPDRYLAGILTDGNPDIPSVIDRQVVRYRLLENRGWHLLEICALAWWREPEVAAEALHQALLDLMELDQVSLEPHELAAQNDEPARDARQVSPTVSGQAEPEQARGGVTDPGDPEPIEIDAGDDEDDEEDWPETEILDIAPDANPMQFNDPSYDDQLKAMIERTVQEEGPLRDDVLAKRIAKAHGFGRAGGWIHDRILALVPSSLPVTSEENYQFYWPRLTNPATWDRWRRLPRGETETVEQMPIEELRALCRATRGRNVSEAEHLDRMLRELGLADIDEAGQRRLAQARGGR